MRLTWPATCATYTLQTTTHLDTPIHWVPAAETPVAVGDGYAVTLPATNITRFFRLRTSERTYLPVSRERIG